MKTVTRKVGKPDSVRAMAVKATAAKFECDTSYVRKIVEGVRENEEIKRFYNDLYSRISKAKAV